jgi:hypothetical protein
VQWQQQQPGALGQRRAGSRGPANFGRAGEKHQHIAGQASVIQGGQRAGHLLLQRLAGIRRVEDIQIEDPAPGAHHRATAEEPDQRAGVERGRHHHQAQVTPVVLLQAAEQGQREIAIQVPLVEFIQHHGADMGQLRIGKEAAGQHALGHEAQAGARAGHFFETHLVPDALPERLAALEGHAPGRQAGRQPPRFQHPHLAREHVQQRRGNARGLARSRRRLHQQAAARSQVFLYAGNGGVDRQPQHAPSA